MDVCEALRQGVVYAEAGVSVVPRAHAAAAAHPPGQPRDVISAGVNDKCERQ